MTAGIYDAYIEQGANWLLTLTIVDSVSVPLDLTGYTGQSQIRATTASTVVIASPTVAFATPRSSGIVTLSLTAAQTAAFATAGLRYLETTNWIWEFILTASNGTVLRVLNGAAYISPGGMKA